MTGCPFISLHFDIPWPHPRPCLANVHWNACDKKHPPSLLHQRAKATLATQITAIMNKPPCSQKPVLKRCPCNSPSNPAIRIEKATHRTYPYRA